MRQKRKKEEVARIRSLVGKSRCFCDTVYKIQKLALMLRSYMDIQGPSGYQPPS